jgi:hypothetical protein
MLPASIAGRRDAKLRARPVVDGRDRSDTVARLLDWLFDYSGRPNHYDWDGPTAYDLVAPLELKFFAYFLERHLGLCFHPRTFRRDRCDFLDKSYEEFAESITIFAHDDVEGRLACDLSASIGDADILDGSELLARSPCEDKPFYREREY